MSKEYLDRKEIQKIFDDVTDNYEIEEGIYKKELLLLGDQVDNLITQICQLKPKNQVIKEKITEVLGKYGVICGLQEKYKRQLSIINCDTLYEFYGIIANEILEEE